MSSDKESRKAPNRTQAALLLLGPNAPADENRLQVYRELGFNPPEDFVITPFDQFMLSGYLADGGLEDYAPSSAELAKSLRARCAKLGYDTFEFTEVQINNYFDILRGKKLGARQTETLSRNFPSIRERFNAMFMLKMIERGKVDVSVFPNYKEFIQYKTAQALVSGATHLEIIEDLKVLTPHHVVDMMILDLVEVIGPEKLQGHMLEAVNQYPETKTRIVDAYVDKLHEGKLLINAFNNPKLGQHMGACIAELWLEEFKRAPDAFSARNLSYTREIIRYYIMGDVARAANYLGSAERYAKLGITTPTMASHIISFIFGHDREKYSVVESLDHLGYGIEVFP